MTHPSNAHQVEIDALSGTSFSEVVARDLPSTGVEPNVADVSAADNNLDAAALRLSTGAGRVLATDGQLSVSNRQEDPKSKEVDPSHRDHLVAAYHRPAYLTVNLARRVLDVVTVAIPTALLTIPSYPVAPLVSLGALVGLAGLNLYAANKIDRIVTARRDRYDGLSDQTGSYLKEGISAAWCQEVETAIERVTGQKYVYSIVKNDGADALLGRLPLEDRAYEVKSLFGIPFSRKMISVYNADSPAEVQIRDYVPLARVREVTETESKLGYVGAIEAKESLHMGQDRRARNEDIARTVAHEIYEHRVRLVQHTRLFKILDGTFRIFFPRMPLPHRIECYANIMMRVPGRAVVNDARRTAIRSRLESSESKGLGLVDGVLRLVMPGASKAMRLELLSNGLVRLPKWYYLELKSELQQTVLLPAVTSERILEAARSSRDKKRHIREQAHEPSVLSPEEILALKDVYGYVESLDAANKDPDSVSPFAHASIAAEDAAELGLPVSAIGALFLQRLPKRERDSLLIENLGRATAEVMNIELSNEESKELDRIAAETRRVLRCLDRMLVEPLLVNYPKPDRPDYSAESQINRLLKLSGDLAAKERIPASSVLGAYLCEKLQQIAELDEERDSAALSQIEHQTSLLFAPLCERVGLDSLAAQFRDVTFRVVHPKEYRDAQFQVRSRLKMTKEETGKFCESLEESLVTSVMTAGLDEGDHFQVISRDKTYESARRKANDPAEIKEYHEKLRRGENPGKEGVGIEHHMDLIASTIIVKSPRHLAMIRDSIRDRFHYISNSPGSDGMVRITDREFEIKMAPPYKGEDSYCLMNFECENPFEPGHKFIIEVQIMTERYRNEVFKPGFSDAKYRRAHWQIKLERDARSLLYPNQEIPSGCGQRSDDPGSQLVGDTESDVREAYGRLKDSIFPYVLQTEIAQYDVLDPKFTLPRIPKGSKAVDLLFSAELALEHPLDWEVLRVDGIARPDQKRERFQFKGLTPLELSNEIRNEDILVVRKKLIGDGSVVRHVRPADSAIGNLIQDARSPRARLKLQEMISPGQLENWEKVGKGALSEELIGSIVGDTQQKILSAAAIKLGFLGHQELLQAIGLQLSTSRSDRTVKVLDKMREWYSARYVGIEEVSGDLVTSSAGVPSIGFSLAEEQSSSQIFLKVDENQNGVLTEMLAHTSALGLNIDTFFIGDSENEGEKVVALSFKEPPEDFRRSLLQQLKTINKPRGEREPLINGRHSTLVVAVKDQPHLIRRIVERLASAKVNIGVEGGGDLYDDGERTVIALYLNGPTSENLGPRFTEFASWLNKELSQLNLPLISGEELPPRVRPALQGSSIKIFDGWVSFKSNDGSPIIPQI